MAKKKKEPTSDTDEEGGPSGVTKKGKKGNVTTFEIGDEPDCRKEPKKAPGLLTTREIGQHYLDRESYIKLSLREFLIHMIFLLVLGLLASGQHDKCEYYLTRVLTRLLVETKFKTLEDEVITYNDINTVNQTWDYFNFFVGNLYTDFWYSQALKVDKTSDEDNQLLFQNRLIGVPRIRQLRVRRDSCEIPEDFKSTMSECFAAYSSGSESTESYGFENSSAWIYSPASELHSRPIPGYISTYGGGGFYYDFEKVKDDTVESIMNVTLAGGRWIDRATRAVVMQFTTYNANENFFFTMMLLLEFPPTGGVLPSYTVYTHKFFMRDIWDMVLLVLTGIFCFFVVIFTISEIFEILYFKWSYFNSLWNILDAVILILSYITIALFLYSFLVIQSEIGDLIKVEGKHACFDTVNNAREMYATLLAVVFFFAGIKGAKYLNFNDSMSHMNLTLSKASKDIACFSFVFFVVFMSFAELGYLLFGSQAHDFRTFSHAMFALLRTSVGDFDYNKIEHVNYFMGPVFFFCYIFFIYFILVNMFLAIVIDTYSDVRASLRDRTRDLQASDLFGRWLRRLFGCFGRKGAGPGRPDSTAGAPGTAYADIQNLLRRCGFTEMEIDLFFAKFEIPRDRPISQDEMRDKLMTNFHMKAPEKGKAKLKTSAVGKEEMDELGEKLDSRIKVLEDNIVEVNFKIDLIDNKIDSIQQIRSRRKTTQPKTD